MGSLWLRIERKIWWKLASRFNPLVRAPILKSDMCNRLAKRNQYRSYLEIATNGTGFQYGNISRDCFATIKRIIYRADWKKRDEWPADWVTADDDICHTVNDIRENGETFDVIFIDSFHSYESSRADLEGALELVNEGGIIAVHDCCPPRKEMTHPEPRNQAWVGETYLAFLDYVRDHRELDYCVVKTDFGVGLVWQKGVGRPTVQGDLPPAVDLQDGDYRDWGKFKRDREKLLRLITVKQFEKLFLSPASTWPNGSQ